MKENNSKKLKYRIIEASSEDPEYPVFELLKGMESNGWVSSRFCNYPQEILIQFLSPVNLKQINILSHEKKISSMIEFFSFFPSTNTDIFLNIKALNYEKLGYVRMDNNSKTNFKAREFRKIYVNSNCLYLKISLQRNYINKFNVFNQVSLISIDFYGEPVNVPKVELLIEENLKTNNLNEEQMDELAIEKIRILRQSMDEASKIEDFDEAKRIKGNIDKVRMIGKKIFEHEFQKKIAINNEDFDKAKILKMEIDKLKSFIRNIDKQVLNLSPIDNHNKTDIDINIKLKNLYDIEETKIGQGENMYLYFNQGHFTMISLTIRV